MIVARWRGFSMLLTADAEAEAVPLDPGPVDVLKVAHHGSDDAGLGACSTAPGRSLAVISVGADNPYGHPTPATLATLAEHGVPILRTDRDGDVVIDVERGVDARGQMTESKVEEPQTNRFDWSAEPMHDWCSSNFDRRFSLAALELRRQAVCANGCVAPLRVPRLP